MTFDIIITFLLKKKLCQVYNYNFINNFNEQIKKPLKLIKALKKKNQLYILINKKLSNSNKKQNKNQTIV